MTINETISVSDHNNNDECYVNYCVDVNCDSENVDANDNDDDDDDDEQMKKKKKKMQMMMKMNTNTSMMSTNNTNKQIAIGWRNLRYKVTNWNNLPFFCGGGGGESDNCDDAILQRLNGHFVVGTLNALMGPSGAGKTTLLNVLCGNIRIGLTDDSELYINHRMKSSSSSSIADGIDSPTPSTPKAMCCFVEQHVHETMMTTMTVGELWRYAYRFKNGHSREVITAMEQHIAATLESLLLPPDILTRVLSHCSGGEQKRVAIGQELMCLTAPSLMMIDEPTTGLDSAAALVVMQALHRLTVQQHITVITSIHLPSQEILRLFDRLYVLAKGGVCVYAGPPNGIEIQLQLQLGVNVADDQPPIEALISIACEGLQHTSVQILAKHNLQVEHDLLCSNLSTITTNLSSSSSSSNHHHHSPHHYQPHKPFYPYDLYLHLHRLFRNTFIANYRVNCIIVLLHLIFFFLLSTMFDHPAMTQANGCITTIGMDNSTCGELIHQDSLFKENMNYIVYTFVFAGLMITVTSLFFLSNVKIFRAEYRNQWYSLMVYYCSSTLITLLEMTFYATLITLLAYFFTTQHAADDYAINWRRLRTYGGFVWLHCFYMQTFFQLICILLANQPDLALMMCNIFHSFVTVLNGFLVDINGNRNFLVKLCADILALHYIGEGIIYAFYGIDRCDPQTEESLILIFYRIDRSMIRVNIVRVLTTIGVVRLFALVLFCARFNTNWLVMLKKWWWWLRWSKSSSSSSLAIGDGVSDSDHQIREMIPINFKQYRTYRRSSKLTRISFANIDDVDEIAAANRRYNSKNVKIDIEKLKKVSTIPVATPNLLYPVYGKIIIAWRHLHLYGSSSIFESIKSASASASASSSGDGDAGDSGSVEDSGSAGGGEVDYDQYSTSSSSSSSSSSATPILRNLCGQLRFGTLNALMGTSGAGKTSLLRVLNGQYKTRLDSRTQWYLSRYAKIETCFITQEVSGHLLSGLTAKELLVFASRLKNATIDDNDAKASTKIDHNAVAMRVLRELDLLNIEHTRVEHCSGGERKRLALGVELTATIRVPNLICIDEPTSGLDSTSAEVVVATLCRLVRHNPICIVASIHQPNTRVLSMFDQLYVLARGGVCIYDGPVNGIQTRLNLVKATADAASAVTVNDHHHHHPRAPPMSLPKTKTTFPIEQLITYSCAGHRHSAVQALVHHQMEQTYGVKLCNELQHNCRSVPDGVQHNRCRFSPRSTVILFSRYLAYIRAHQWYEWLFYIVNYLAYACTLRMFYDSTIANASGCIDLRDDFNSSCNRDVDQLQEEIDLVHNFKYSFFFTLFYLFFVMTQASLDFRHDLQLMINEHRNGWYSAGVFYLTKSLVDILPLVPLNLIYVYIGNLYSFIRPAIYWYFVCLFTWSAIAIQGMGQMFAVMSHGHALSTMVVASIVVFMCFTVLGNFFLPIPKLHIIYKFVAYFSIPRYIFESLILLQYGFGRCAPEEIQGTLYIMALTDSDLWRNMALLTLVLLLYRLITWLLLYRLVNPHETQQKRAQRIGENLRKLHKVGVQNGIL